MEAEDIATAASDAATELFQADQDASVDLAASIDDVAVTSVVLAPTGDLVVFFDDPGKSHCAWATTLIISPRTRQEGGSSPSWHCSALSFRPAMT
jgi:hypothetical protein